MTRVAAALPWPALIYLDIFSTRTSNHVKFSFTTTLKGHIDMKAMSKNPFFHSFYVLMLVLITGVSGALEKETL